MKRILMAVLSLCLILTALTGSAMAAEEDIYVAMFPKAYIGDFWKSVELGARAAASDFGVTITFEGPSTETDLEGQIKLIENAIIKEADVIALAPLDSVGNIPVIEGAIEKGIKIITFNSKLDGDMALTHIATDNWAAGEMAGKTLGEALGGKGKFAIIGANDAVKNNRDRSDGAADYIAKNFPEMELITIRYTDGDMTKALSAASDIITANPDIAGFFTNNETTTIALATVLQERNLIGKIAHVGFDATEQTAGYLADGTTYAIVTQVPYNMGYIAVEKALSAYKGEALEPSYDTGAALVTRENMNTEEMQKIIKPQG
ncbi:MAG: ABC transporter substrate-binding protein [Clostridia bacterium]